MKLFQPLFENLQKLVNINFTNNQFIGTIPATFVSVALGSGIENIIDQNAELNFSSVFFSPEIYLPIIGFFVLLASAYVIKKFFFKG